MTAKYSTLELLKDKERWDISEGRTFRNPYPIYRAHLDFRVSITTYNDSPGFNHGRHIAVVNGTYITDGPNPWNIKTFRLLDDCLEAISRALDEGVYCDD